MIPQVGAIIRELLQKGYTQNRLAKALQTTQQTISDLKGDHGDSTWEKHWQFSYRLHRLAEQEGIIPLDKERQKELKMYVLNLIDIADATLIPARHKQFERGLRRATQQVAKSFKLALSESRNNRSIERPGPKGAAKRDSSNNQESPAGTGR